ncbi:DUF6272 family protein [Coleofasciculus sp. E2-BRE-01]|uniref:DUF6272 family protein n=1 Tax=Coleofasciculus sp. E2-BRE-01 TaxID=3069524 RepID=UPI004063A58E
MAMHKIFGEFQENLSDEQEFLILGFSPSSIPIQQRWRNNGLSADFVADYLTTFFPAIDEDPDPEGKRVEIKGAVSYIANELLENAMKFNDDHSSYPIKFGLHILDIATEITLVLLATNSVSKQSLNKFQSFIHELLESDLDELYIRQLEKSAEDETGAASGLGLLTMKNDYFAKLGWKFETVQKEPEVVTVTTMVQLKV